MKNIDFNEISDLFKSWSYRCKRRIMEIWCIVKLVCCLALAVITAAAGILMLLFFMFMIAHIADFFVANPKMTLNSLKEIFIQHALLICIGIIALPMIYYAFKDTSIFEKALFGIAVWAAYFCAVVVVVAVAHSAPALGIVVMLGAILFICALPKVQLGRTNC